MGRRRSLHEPGLEPVESPFSPDPSLWASGRIVASSPPRSWRSTRETADVLGTRFKKYFAVANQLGGRPC